MIGLVVFYITSRYLNKDDFGNLNWLTAIGSTIIAVASFGIDLVLVKRIAKSQSAYESVNAHFFHTLFVGFGLVLVIYFFGFYFTKSTHFNTLFLLVFINLAIANISNTFKLCLNGFEAFKHLAIITVTLNLLKLIGLVFLLLAFSFSVHQIVLMYIVASFIELILASYFANQQFTQMIQPKARFKFYLELIKESLPQFGVVLFDSALSRMDWILMGLISTLLATAEYSFAYRIFELSRLPILIIAPILLTRFSKLLGTGNQLSDEKQREINVFLQFGLFLSMLIPICTVSAWSPLIDSLTDNKYGRVNEINYMILAICVPFHFLINFLWTLGFVQSQSKQIMFITIFTSLLNVVLNSILIKSYGAMGASVSFLISTLIQLLLYFIFIHHSMLQFKLKGNLMLFLLAIFSIILAKLFTVHYIIQTFIAISFYILVSLVTKLSNLKMAYHLVRGIKT